ncbi:MAG TPA: hypothetical protein VMC80_03285 [Patescibacteria group bacterium]|nr:hypothetical protein [Patescibacteria group bacterium]
MAVREDAKEPKRNELESLSLGELHMKIAQETARYINNVLSNPGVDRERIMDDYMQRVQIIADEITKKEQLYFKGHKSNQRY